MNGCIIYKETKIEREEIMKNHREQIKDVHFKSKKAIRRFKDVSFFIVTHYVVEDGLIYPQVIGVKDGREIFEFVFHGYEVPGTGEVSDPFSGKVSLSFEEDEFCLEVEGKEPADSYQSIVYEYDQESEGELRGTFRDLRSHRRQS